MNGRRCDPRGWEGDERFLDVLEEGSMIVSKNRCEMCLGDICCSNRGRVHIPPKTLAMAKQAAGWELMIP